MNTITAYAHDIWGGDKLAEFQKRFDALVQSVPEEYRSTIRVEFQTEEGGSPWMYLSYERPKNATELQMEADDAARRLQEELKLLETLKAKYEQ